MSAESRKRALFQPVQCRMTDRFYSDAYFNRSQDILIALDAHPRVRLQFFQRHDNVCLCGINEILQIMASLPDAQMEGVRLFSLKDGALMQAWETAVILECDYSLLAPLETVLLGVLARGTLVATNAFRCAQAARGKPVLCFCARFDHYWMQPWDGYAYQTGCKAAGVDPAGVSTDAQGAWWGRSGLGTIPHAMIAVCGGDTVRAALAFAEHMDAQVPRIVLADFTNDCVGVTLAVAAALYDKFRITGDARYRLAGVRLDTAGDLVDRSLQDRPDAPRLTGVCAELVWNVHHALRAHAAGCPENSGERAFYEGVQIYVSGGFTPERIAAFEDAGVPVDAYGVGSALYAGRYDFTADIVSLFENGAWRDCAKSGRSYRPNDRLQEWTAP